MNDSPVAASPLGPTLGMAAGQAGAGHWFGVLRGLLTVDAGDTRWLVRPGRAAWVPPERLQALQGHGAVVGWHVTVGAAACAGLPGVPVTTALPALLREAVARVASWSPGPLDATRWRLAGVVLDEIAACRPEPFGLPRPTDPRLQAVADDLLADLPGARGVEDLAARAGVPARTLTRQFSTDTGFSLADWRQRARLMQALAWLAEGRPLNVVAADLGYDQTRAFTAMFRRELGEGPGAFAGAAPR